MFVFLCFLVVLFLVYFTSSLRTSNKLVVGMWLSQNITFLCIYWDGSMVFISIKFDVHTSNINWAWYARICIKINISKHLPPKIRIGKIAQPIHCESKSILCFNCMRFIGHVAQYCNTAGLLLKTKISAHIFLKKPRT